MSSSVGALGQEMICHPSESDRVSNDLHDSNSIFRAGRIKSEWVRARTVTPTTPESRTDQHKETCTETSERKDLNYCQVHLNPDSIHSLALFSDFLVLFGSFASRQQTSIKETCADMDRETVV